MQTVITENQDEARRVGSVLTRLVSLQEEGVWAQTEKVMQDPVRRRRPSVRDATSPVASGGTWAWLLASTCQRTGPAVRAALSVPESRSPAHEGCVHEGKHTCVVMKGNCGARQEAKVKGEAVEGKITERKSVRGRKVADAPLHGAVEGGAERIQRQGQKHRLQGTVRPEVNGCSVDARP